MHADNPYEPPQEEMDAASPAVPPLRKIGTTILLIGLATLAYGAIACWLLQRLPPNGGGQGRLPSVYMMGIGIVIVLVGLVVRDLRVGRKAKRTGDESRKGIPTSYGILILLAIVIVFVVVISQL